MILFFVNNKKIINYFEQVADLKYDFCTAKLLLVKYNDEYKPFKAYPGPTKGHSMYAVAYES
jgi:hypothetical protein